MNKDTLEVLDDVAKETVEACARMSKVVEGKGKIEDVCKEIIQGYWYVTLFLCTCGLFANRGVERLFSALHLSLGRYRLDEIGLGENIPYQ